jgi:isopenicillin-N epimerase
MNAPSLSPPPPIRPNVRADFAIDPGLTLLNHGSFGATPRVVLAEQSMWRDRIEADPIEMLVRQGPALLEKSKTAIGNWLGMKPEDFGFVTNATEGINCVLRSLDFQPGDELLTTNHVYNAVRQAMKYIATKSSAVYREIDVPIPVKSCEEIETTILRAITARTKLLVIDQITSPTALIFPIENIIAACAGRGVDVLVDGAHGPGMVPLNIEKLGAAYYAGNLHKWGCAPKGSAFLWVRNDKQKNIHPLIVSHFYEQGLAKEFGWQGTHDISGWLSIPRVLQYMNEIGWQRIMAHNHAMAAWMNQFLCAKWNVQSISPLDGSLLGSMATVSLPAPLDAMSSEEAQKFSKTLHDRDRIEVPIMNFSGEQYIRPCCQIYNEADDIVHLADVIGQPARYK